MERARRDRRCRFQRLEPRQLLAVDFGQGTLSLGPAEIAEPLESLTGGLLAGESVGGSIGGHVYLADSHASEGANQHPGLEGVTLRLLNETGAILEETETDTDGNFQFTDLSPGVYAVLEVQPTEYVDGSAAVGSCGGVVFDNNLLGEIVIQADAAAVGYNFFEQLADTVTGTDIGDQPLIAHADGSLSGGELQISDGAILRLLYGAAQPPSSSPKAAFLPSSISSAIAVDTASPLETNIAEPVFGGSSSSIIFAWQLSVLVDGDSLGSHYSSNPVALVSTQTYAPVWPQTALDQGAWRIASVDSSEAYAERDAVFGHPNALAVAGDWDGDGHDEFGVFLDGQWYLDLNGNGRWDEADLWAQLGSAGDIPVAGDWNGDGISDIGVFGMTSPRQTQRIDSPHLRQGSSAAAAIDAAQDEVNLPQCRTCRTAHGKLRAEAVDQVFHTGVVGDLPITGDWDGDGADTIGVYRDGKWRLDLDGDGKFTETDAEAHFGTAGDLPVVGDWDGSGRDQLGVFRSGTWIVDRNGNNKLDHGDYDRAFELGAAGDQPVVGDWDGNGTDDAGIYQPSASQPRMAQRRDS